MPNAHAPRVSVVIPAYNVERHIVACLGSIRAQTVREWECIVVDDGSTDRTAQRIREHAEPRIRLLAQANLGVSAARNAGLAEAKAAYVLFLDGDDLLHPRALERLAAQLDASPDAVAAYGSAWAIFEDGSAYPQSSLQRRRFASGNLLEALMRWEIFLPMGCTLARTECARNAGGFNERLRLSEDWEFWCRLAAHGDFGFIGAVPEASYVRLRTWSASRQLSPSWENHLPTIQAVISNPSLAAKFDPVRWRRLTREVLASQLWEAGRMNFISRRYAEARRLMLSSFAEAVTARRVALFLIAQASQLIGVSLVPRLRFLDEDARQ
jgi:glycosyltransferase involved in cell wall biosynthesis